MKPQTISQVTVDRKEFHLILREFTEFFKYPTKKLVKHLREDLGYSYQKISDIMGISKQQVKESYGK